MKKSFKKVLAAMLSVVLLTTMGSFSAFAAVDTTKTTVTELTIGTDGTFNGSGVVPSVLTDVGGAEGNVMGWDFTSYTGSVTGTDSNTGKDILTSGQRYDFPAHDATVIKQHTYEFNMYADGNAIAHLSYASGNAILRWDPDGSLWFNVNGAMTNMGTYERGKWLHVALSYRDGDRYILYVNDEKLSDNSAWGIGNGKTFGFGVGVGSYGGIVAYDDIIKYDGLYANYYSEPVYHDASDHAITTGDTDTIQFVADSEKIIFKKCADVEALTSEIKLAAGAQYVKVFNADMTAAASDLSEAKLAVIKSTGDVYYYYNLDENIVNKAGLYVDETGYTEEDLASNRDSLISVYDDCVGIFSGNHIILARISDTIVENVIKSSNGYTVSYVNSNKEEVSCEHIIDGYIKAEKDSEVLYVPITRRYEETPINGSSIAASNNGEIDLDVYKTNRVAWYSSVNLETSVTAGLGGKSSDDTAFGFVTTKAGMNRFDITPRKDADSNNYVGKSDTGSAKLFKTFTFEFNWYADSGDTDAVFATRAGAYKNLVWKSDGSLWFRARAEKTESGTIELMDTGIDMARGKWHRIAVTFDSVYSRTLVYLDGKLILNTEYTPYDSEPYPITLGSDYVTSSGKVYYDDAIFYEGYYYDDGDTVSVVNSDSDIRLDSEDKVIYYNTDLDLDTLISKLDTATDASEIKVFADNTFAAAATSIDAENNVVMLTSVNGEAYEYYTLEAIDISDITFSVADDTITASVVAYSDSYADSKLYIASYDGLKLVGVTPATVNVGQASTSSIAYNSAYRYRAFIWTQDVVPMFDVYNY